MSTPYCSPAHWLLDMLIISTGSILWSHCWQHQAKYLPEGCSYQPKAQVKPLLWALLNPSTLYTSAVTMKASPLLVSWHNDNTPIYAVHFEPHGKGRLATGGGDNNVRLWKVDREGEERVITYLSTLIRVSLRDAFWHCWGWWWFVAHSSRQRCPFRPSR